MPSDKRARQRAGREARQAALSRQRKRRASVRRIVTLVVIAGVVVGVIVLLDSGKAKKASNKTTTTTTSSSTTTTAAGTPPSAAPVTGGGTLKSWSCPNPDGSSSRIAHFPTTPPPMCIDTTKTYTVTLTTNQGNITFTLDTKNTPKTANNFVVLSLYHYYDGTSIDRIDTSIDIEQTGSPNTQSISDPGPGYNIPDEPTMTADSSGQLTGPYKYSAGDVVMARGSGANSGSSQYFFVYGAAASALNSQGTYVTFAHTDQASLAVLNTIAGLYEPCPSSDQTCLGGAPKSVVLISKVTVSVS